MQLMQRTLWSEKANGRTVLLAAIEVKTSSENGEAVRKSEHDHTSGYISEYLLVQEGMRERAESVSATATRDGLQNIRLPAKRERELEERSSTHAPYMGTLSHCSVSGFRHTMIQLK